MVTAGAVTLVMVAVVLLGNGLIPPKWRGGACLMAGVCPDPEDSPDPIGVPVNPGVAELPREKAGPRAGERYPEGKCSLGPAGPGSRGGRPGPAPFPLPWGYPHVRQPSEMTGPGGPRGPGGPSDPRGPCHPLRKAAEQRPWAGFVDP